MRRAIFIITALWTTTTPTTSSNIRVSVDLYPKAVMPIVEVAESHQWHIPIPLVSVYLPPAYNNNRMERLLEKAIQPLQMFCANNFANLIQDTGFSQKRVDSYFKNLESFFKNLDITRIKSSSDLFRLGTMLITSNIYQRWTFIVSAIINTANYNYGGWSNNLFKSDNPMARYIEQTAPIVHAYMYLVWKFRLNGFPAQEGIFNYLTSAVLVDISKMAGNDANLEWHIRMSETVANSPTAEFPLVYFKIPGEIPWGARLKQQMRNYHEVNISSLLSNPALVLETINRLLRKWVSAKDKDGPALLALLDIYASFDDENDSNADSSSVLHESRASICQTRGITIKFILVEANGVHAEIRSQTISRLLRFCKSSLPLELRYQVGVIPYVDMPLIVIPLSKHKTIHVDANVWQFLTKTWPSKQMDVISLTGSLDFQFACLHSPMHEAATFATVLEKMFTAKLNTSDPYSNSPLFVPQFNANGIIQQYNISPLMHENSSYSILRGVGQLIGLGIREGGERVIQTLLKYVRVSYGESDVYSTLFFNSRAIRDGVYDVFYFNSFENALMDGNDVLALFDYLENFPPAHSYGLVTVSEKCGYY